MDYLYLSGGVCLVVVECVFGGARSVPSRAVRRVGVHASFMCVEAAAAVLRRARERVDHVRHMQPHEADATEIRCTHQDVYPTRARRCCQILLNQISAHDVPCMLHKRQNSDRRRCNSVDRARTYVCVGDMNFNVTSSTL